MRRAFFEIITAPLPTYNLYYIAKRQNCNPFHIFATGEKCCILLQKGANSVQVHFLHKKGYPDWYQDNLCILSGDYSVTGTLSANVGNGTKVINRYTGGEVFATYISDVPADANDFTTSGYSFYVNNGNVYMQ